MNTSSTKLAKPSPAPLLSPKGMLAWAARLSGMLMVLHLLGARECTSVLSGTLGEPLRMFLGVSYTLAYFIAAAFAPPLLVAGLLSGAIGWVRARGAPTLVARKPAHVC